jgi:hypothetical protein
VPYIRIGAGIPKEEWKNDATGRKKKWCVIPSCFESKHDSVQ